MTSDEINIAAPNMVEANIEVKELAEFMGLSEKNISARLTRIREKMKQYLIEREVFVWLKVFQSYERACALSLLLD